MGAPIGNNYWQFRNKHGRNFKYDPELLWNEFIDYARWIEDTPLYEEKGFAYMGTVTKEKFQKMRAMTIDGFCLFADIDDQTLLNYENNKDFIEVVKAIKKAIRTQKIEGAAAGLLNASIISQELGLINKSEVVNNNTISFKDVSKK